MFIKHVILDCNLLKTKCNETEYRNSFEIKKMKLYVDFNFSTFHVDISRIIYEDNIRIHHIFFEKETFMQSL